MAEDLQVWREADGGSVVVYAAGDVDLSTAPSLEEQLRAACAEVGPSQPVVADLTRVGSFESTGLGVLVQVYQWCQERELRLKVVPSPAVLRPLRLTGLTHTIEVVEQP